MDLSDLFNTINHRHVNEDKPILLTVETDRKGQSLKMRVLSPVGEVSTSDTYVTHIRRFLYLLNSFNGTEFLADKCESCADCLLVPFPFVDRVMIGKVEKSDGTGKLMISDATQVLLGNLEGILSGITSVYRKTDLVGVPIPSKDKQETQSETENIHTFSMMLLVGMLVHTETSWLG